jgi:hypothetical protein
MVKSKGWLAERQTMRYRLRVNAERGGPKEGPSDVPFWTKSGAFNGSLMEASAAVSGPVEIVRPRPEALR